MGLDWVPIRKPKPGHEEEFRAVLAFLSRGDDPVGDDPLLSRIRALSDDQQRELYENVSISPYVSLGAPMVGRDANADEFVRQRWREQSSDAQFLAENPTPEAFVASMSGYYATEVMPRSAGLPFYQTTVGELIDFRAKFLDDVEGEIGEALYEESFENKFLCADAVDYADRLIREAEKLGGDRREHEWSLPFWRRVRPKKTKAHILLSAAGWIHFWAELGHGYRADY